MDWPVDGVASLFLVSFFVGLLFSVVSFFLDLGHGSGGLDSAGHGMPALGDTHLQSTAGFGHLGHSHSAGADAAEPAAAPPSQAPKAGGAKAGHSGPAIVNLSTIMAFLTWFGGAGYIVRVFYGAWTPVALLTAAVIGLVGASLVFLFLSRVLYANQRILNPADYHLPGTLARVTSSIRPDGTGEIVYTQGGSRYVAGARAQSGQAIAKGTEVVVMRYSHGIAYVVPWEELMSDQDTQPSGAGRDA